MAIIIHFCFDIATIVRLYWDCNIVSIQTTINFTIALYCIDNCFGLSTVLSGAVGAVDLTACYAIRKSFQDGLEGILEK